MKTILAATDFSPAATNAVYYAADMAAALNASLYLLHVYQLPVAYMEVPVAMTDEELTASSERLMVELKQNIATVTKNKIAIETEVTIGNFYAELETTCNRIKPYIVVMGSQGTTATERFFLGGHILHALRHLEWPILTVQPKAKFDSIKNIALACDFDEAGETLPVEEIRSIVNEFNATLHVLNIGRLGKYDPDITYKTRIVKRKLEPLHPEYHFLAHLDVDEGIMSFIEKNKINMLIVVPKKHDIIEQLFHKSHSKQLVIHSLVPLLAVHR